MAEKLIRQDIERRLVIKSWKDEAFRKQLLEDPKVAIEQEFGGKIPEDVEIVVHEETPKERHLVLCAKPELVPEPADVLGQDDEQSFNCITISSVETISCCEK